MESSRRQQAQADLGMDFAKEDQKREAALAKEQARAPVFVTFLGIKS